MANDPECPELEELCNSLELENEKLKASLAKMLEVYWSDDGQDPPEFIKQAMALTGQASP